MKTPNYKASAKLKFLNFLQGNIKDIKIKVLGTDMSIESKYPGNL